VGEECVVAGSCACAKLALADNSKTAKTIRAVIMMLPPATIMLVLLPFLSDARESILVALHRLHVDVFRFVVIPPMDRIRHRRSCDIRRTTPDAVS
jgi:hypothetical protein